MSDDTCPTCGATVEVVTADEGTSHYRPVPEADLEAAEARAEKAEAALKPFVVAYERAHYEFVPDTLTFKAFDRAREALASHPDNPPPPPPPTPGLGRPETSGGKGKR